MSTEQHHRGGDERKALEEPRAIDKTDRVSADEVVRVRELIEGRGERARITPKLPRQPNNRCGDRGRKHPPGSGSGNARPGPIRKRAQEPSDEERYDDGLADPEVPGADKRRDQVSERREGGGEEQSAAGSREADAEHEGDDELGRPADVEDQDGGRQPERDRDDRQTQRQRSRHSRARAARARRPARATRAAGRARAWPPIASAPRRPRR